jgi:uncharacterized protein YceK
MKSIVIILWVLLSLVLSACTSNTSEANKTGEEVNLTIPQETDWEQAKEWILAGKVETLTQAHNLTVILVLKDGSQFTTKEPVLDEIFKVVEQCSAKCSEITIATE